MHYSRTVDNFIECVMWIKLYVLTWVFVLKGGHMIYVCVICGISVSAYVVYVCSVYNNNMHRWLITQMLTSPNQFIYSMSSDGTIDVQWYFSSTLPCFVSIWSFCINYFSLDGGRLNLFSNPCICNFDGYFWCISPRSFVNLKNWIFSFFFLQQALVD